MKNEKHIEMIEMIDDDIIIEADKEIDKREKNHLFKHKWAIGTVVAACFVFTVLSFMYFALKTDTEGELISRSKLIKSVMIGDQEVWYEIRTFEDAELSSHFINDKIIKYTKQLDDIKGEIFSESENETIYYVDGRDDLVYLIFETDVELKLGIFDEYGFEDYQYSSVLSEIYGVSSTNDIKSIKFSMYNTGPAEDALLVFVPEIIISNIETIHRFYSLLCNLAYIDYEKLRGYIYDDEDEVNSFINQVNEKGILGVQFNRTITITLINDEEILFIYNPLTRLLYQYGGIFYEPITKEDNQWLIDLAEISFD